MAYDPPYVMKELEKVVATIRRCPRCGSTSVDAAQRRDMTSDLAVEAYCSSCGHKKKALVTGGAHQWSDWS